MVQAFRLPAAETAAPKSLGGLPLARLRFVPSDLEPDKPALHVLRDDAGFVVWEGGLLSTGSHQERNFRGVDRSPR